MHPCRVLQRCRECTRHLAPLLTALDGWGESESKVGKLARSRLTGLAEMVGDYLPRGTGGGGGAAPKLAPLPRT